MVAGLIAAFVLFLREGLEGSLIISILFSALCHLGQTRQMRAVWIGVGLAIGASLAGGIVIYMTVHEYEDTIFQTIFETVTYLVAAILLTLMSFLLQKHSNSEEEELLSKIGSAHSGFALGVLAFTTVGREGLEAVIFSLALAFQTSGVILLSGALLGVLTSVGLSWLIYHLGYRLDFRLFFRVMGIVLFIVTAALLADAIQNLQALGWLPIGTMQLWHSGRFLSEDSPLGDALHAFLGYSENPTLLQTLFYLGYLMVTGFFFMRLVRRKSGQKTTEEAVGGSSETVSQV